ncbi:MAG: uracil-DNA glycosylase family protein, partial [Candidatus Thorarchaeota archaeon]
MRRTYVPPSGNKDAKLAGVGEQPGMEEIRSRPPKPFVGPAGRGLEECLQMTKIVRRDLYLTNVIKDLDAPLKHYIDLGTRGNPTIHPEGYQYIQELAEELKSLNLNAVIAFGNIALLALTNRVGITKWRGSVLESTIVPGLKVIPTFHPATFIPPKFNFLNRPLICEDLLQAKYESEFKEIVRQPRDITV